MKSNPIKMSMRTRQNWIIDAAVFLGGVVAALTGIYFLFLPTGGYQGGRNPMYGLTILFERHTWSDLHLWGGILMIAAIAAHFAIHWQWVKRMSGRTVAGMRAQGPKLSKGSKINMAINLLVAVSFLLCALSGIYFIFGPSGGYQGGQNAAYDPGFLFTRTTWDLIHTWSGVGMIVAAAVHFAIHWRWVRNVTARFFLSLLPQSQIGQPPTRGETVLASSDQT